MFFFGEFIIVTEIRLMSNIRITLNPAFRRAAITGTLITVMLIFACAARLFAAEVKNITTKHKGAIVVFEYDIIGDEKETDVTIALTMEGRTYHAADLHLRGDFGKVKTGGRKRIIWYAMRDFPEGYPDKLIVDIIAGKGSYRDPVTGMEFIFVKGGCFDMGDASGKGALDERPVHKVCLDDYYMGKYEVTQEDWKKIMDDNPSHFGDCGKCPVEKVSWDDAREYIAELNRKTWRKYRLPTEAEWEYAARDGGETRKWAGTCDMAALDEYAWYSGNSDSKTHPVGRKKPNDQGLHDMTGNVWEWTSDLYDEEYYRESPKKNPSGPDFGLSRVVRGGSWNYDPHHIRTASRFRSLPAKKLSFLGFRLAFTAQ